MTFVGDVLSSQYELVPAEVHFIPLACRGFVRIPGDANRVGHRQRARCHQRTRPAPHVRPPPNLPSKMRSPDATCPSRTAWSSAIGRDGRQQPSVGLMKGHTTEILHGHPEFLEQIRHRRDPGQARHRAIVATTFLLAQPPMSAMLPSSSLAAPSHGAH